MQWLNLTQSKRQEDYLSTTYTLSEDSDLDWRVTFFGVVNEKGFSTNSRNYAKASLSGWDVACNGET